MKPAARPARRRAAPAPSRERLRAPREQLLEVVVEYATEDDPAVVDVAIRLLRRAMELGAKE